MKQQIEDVAAQHHEVAMAFGVSYESFRGAVEAGAGLGIDNSDKRLEQLLMSLQDNLQSIESAKHYGELKGLDHYIEEAQCEVSEALAIIRLED